MLKICDYEVIIFDCDGVILDSNSLKSDAFYNTVIKWGEGAAKKFVAYHKLNGGISRYLKFDYFFRNILEVEMDDKTYNSTLQEYADIVFDGLMNCEIAEGLVDLRNKNKSAQWFVASGGNEQELRRVFKKRNLEEIFNGGVFGSPTDKLEIVSRELKANISNKSKVLMLGDSLYDYKVAMENNIDFCFVNDWSEFSDGELYFEKLGVDIIGKLADLNE